MKPILVFCLVLFSLHSYSQDVNFNQGKPALKEYYTVIPFQAKLDIPIIRVEIKGRHYNFMVDTGAMTAVSSQIAEALGISPHADITIRDSGEIQSQMQVVTIDSISIGGVDFTGIPAVILPPSEFLRCLGIDGNIGSNLLRNSAIQFSSKEKTISLTDKGKNLRPDKKRSVKMELNDVQSSPFISVEHSNGAATVREVLLIDTGMSGMYDFALPVYEQRFKRTAVFTELYSANGSFAMGIHGPANDEKQYKVIVPRMDIAGSILTNITAASTAGTNSRIGAGLLKHGTVTLDYAGGKFYFEPYENGPLDLSEKSWPVDPTLRDGKFVIGMVWDASLGNMVKPGDEILKMGEVNYENIDICDIAMDRRLFENDTITLVLKDAETGAVKEVQITRK